MMLNLRLSILSASVHRCAAFGGVRPKWNAPIKDSICNSTHRALRPGRLPFWDKLNLREYCVAIWCLDAGIERLQLHEAGLEAARSGAGHQQAECHPAKTKTS